MAPGANARGDHVVVISATDNGDGSGEPLTGGYTFVIKVTSPNEAPVISYLGDVVAVFGETMRVTVNVSDMDQDAAQLWPVRTDRCDDHATATYGRALIEWTPTPGSGRHIRCQRYGD